MFVNFLSKNAQGQTYKVFLILLKINLVSSKFNTDCELIVNIDSEDKLNIRFEQTQTDTQSFSSKNVKMRSELIGFFCFLSWSYKWPPTTLCGTSNNSFGKSQSVTNSPKKESHSVSNRGIFFPAVAS